MMYLEQITSVENCEETKCNFAELMGEIKRGRPDIVANYLKTLPRSDREPLFYDDILEDAKNLGERIVFDDGLYVLTASECFVTLYVWKELNECVKTSVNRAKARLMKFGVLGNCKLFDEQVDFIRIGRPDIAIDAIMRNYRPLENDTLMTYNDVMREVMKYRGRIAFDNGKYMLSIGSGYMTLYCYIGETSDMLGNNLELGDKVLWANPDDEYRDLNDVWEVGIIYPDGKVRIYLIDDSVTYPVLAEVNPSELVLKSSIIHVENKCRT